jgi:hypothetical protein
MINKPFSWVMGIWSIVMFGASVFQLFRGEIAFALLNFAFFIGSVLMTYNNYYIAEI